MTDSIDAQCPECGSGDTYLVPMTSRAHETFTGAEFQCYGCGHSIVLEQ